MSHTSRLFTPVLIGGAIIATIVGLTSQFRGVVALPQDTTAAVLAVVALSVLAGSSDGADRESAFATVIALIVVTIFGLAALLTTTLGVYAHLATDVAHRRDEMSVRRALGARPDQIGRLVIGRSLRLVSVGFAVGAVVFLLLAPGLRHLLYDVGTTDPLTFVGMWALLAGVALLASLGPASRAAKI